MVVLSITQRLWSLKSQSDIALNIIFLPPRWLEFHTIKRCLLEYVAYKTLVVQYQVQSKNIYYEIIAVFHSMY